MMTQDQMDLQYMMRSDSGRRVLGRILKHSGYFESTQAKTEAETSFHNGRRDEGVWLVQQLRDADPHLTVKIIEDCLNG